MIRVCVLVLSAGLALPLAAPANATDGLTGAEAGALIATAMAAAGVAGRARIAPARPLPACGHAPDVTPAARGDWRSVDLRCSDPAWVRRLRTGAQASPTAQGRAAPPAPAMGGALMLTESLARGTVIEPHHLAQASAGAVPAPGLLGDPGSVIGRRLAVHLGAGRIILARHLDQSFLVRAGNAVAIASGAGGISVSMAGEALQDGQRGDRIAVRNTGSGRIIEAIVTGANSVSVAPNMN